MSQRHRKAWLEGSSRCEPPPKGFANPWRLVLLGAPGVGKGTQAERLADRLGACHLSTGDLFRHALRDPGCVTPAMEQARAVMRRGERVPDATVVDMVRERVACLRCHGGFLLDGFPRTVPQAEALEAMLAEEELALDAVVSFELPVARLVERLSGRRTCPACKAVFHVAARPPAVAGICDHCGEALVQREDDREEAVRVRLRTYEEATAPLVEHYRAAGRLLPVAANGSPEAVFTRTLAALELPAR